MNEKNPLISIVVPLYNETDTFKHLTARLDVLIKEQDFSIEVVLVDDGSSDNTPLLMYETAVSNKNYTCVFLSKNHGHQLAVSAGISNSSASEAIMIIDGDLQDPPELITAFYEKLKQGYDVVYGVRKQRKEGAEKKILYWLYYRLLKMISNTDVQLDSGDFSMISRRVANYMIAMPERSRYLRGIRAWIGFKQFGFEYERSSRFAGEPKYTFKKLFELAYNGIFNFSDFPIKMVTRLGIFVMSGSFIYFLYAIIKKYFWNGVPEGFTALIFLITVFAGVQLISLGILGEYVLRTYQQVQGRPLFTVDKVIRNQRVNSDL
jgi:glycosyltransferase involved in cell wall biosynthesis